MAEGPFDSFTLILNSAQPPDNSAKRILVTMFCLAPTRNCRRKPA